MMNNNVKISKKNVFYIDDTYLLSKMNNSYLENFLFVDMK